MSSLRRTTTGTVAALLVTLLAILAVLATAVPPLQAQTTSWRDAAVLDALPLDIRGRHAGLEMDPVSGLFHATNTTTGRIDIFDHSGAYVESYGSQLVGGLAEPWPVDVEFMGDTIYVSYFRAGAVLAYDRTTLAVKGGFSSLSGLDGPVGIDAANGEVYVAERGAEQVRIYDAFLTFRRAVSITTDNYFGPGQECTISPNDVAVHGGSMYVVGLDVGACGADGIWKADRNFGTTTDQDLILRAFFSDRRPPYSIEVTADGTVLQTESAFISPTNSVAPSLPAGIVAIVTTPGGRTFPHVRIPYSSPTGITVDPSGTSAWVLAVPRDPGELYEPGDRWIFPVTLERCAGQAPTILGTPGPNVVDKIDEPEVIWAGAGDDEIHAVGSDQVVCGGEGADTITSGVGSDTIYGGPGNDLISAGFGVDRIWGGGGDDEIHGEGGSDRIRAGTGNDLVRAGSGADRVWGGPGDDTLNGMGGQDFMYGEAGNDTMQGNWQSDRLWGGPGNDRLAGAQGKDRLWGGEGDDELFGGVNTDYLNGGPGIDIGNGQKGKDNPLVPGVSGCEQLETRSSC